MSELITHYGVYDDCARIAGAAPQVCDAFKETMIQERELARLGTITRWGDRFTIDLLTRTRALWPDVDQRAEARPRLAYVLGWLCHRAADRQVKPLFRAVEPDPLGRPREASIYNEAVVYNKLYRQNRDNPFAGVFDEHTGKSLDGAENLASLHQIVGAMLQAHLIKLHTLIPDPDNIWDWIVALKKRQQEYRTDLERYAEAIFRPDPVKMQKFIEEPIFWDDADALIATARKIETGTCDEVDLDALIEAPCRSHYAQALQLGLSYLRAASLFFDERCDAATLEEAFKIGVPGRDGLGV